MNLDRRLVWVLGIVLRAVLGGRLLDYVLSPPLPVPAGAPPITK